MIYKQEKYRNFVILSEKREFTAYDKTKFIATRVRVMYENRSMGMLFERIYRNRTKEYIIKDIKRDLDLGISYKEH